MADLIEGIASYPKFFFFFTLILGAILYSIWKTPR